MDLHWLWEPEAWIALATLTALEIVLGVDNIIFISILSGKLPPQDQGKARRVGLILAMFMRIGLLLSLSWLVGLKTPLLTVLGQEFTGRDLILLLGGFFLMAKSTREIHHKLEGQAEKDQMGGGPTFAAVVTQILLLDIVFSLDSVITAVGMVDEVAVMVVAVVLSVCFMLAFAKRISDFVENHPTIKMLALSFLLMIGLALVADGLHHHIPKGYIYSAMGFSVLVEMLNLRAQKSSVKAVKLRSHYQGE